MIRPVRVGEVEIGGPPLALIAGPCALEGRDMALRIAETVSRVSRKLGMPAVFKGSYSKDNRSSFESYRGPGLDEGLKILQDVRDNTGLPVLTDVHTPQEAPSVGEVVDMVQIPAFLSRQTGLIVAAAETGRPLNIKKAQFMDPADVRYVVEKAEKAGCRQMTLTERGSFHGYHGLIVDMRSVPMMAETGYPVVFDVTHSLQLPGGASSRGERRWASALARAAVAAGCHCLFMETHPDPPSSLSDRETVLPLVELESFLTPLVALHGWLAKLESASDSVANSPEGS
jgi:2-dehydro-3-deoxyphosphooctonate aldolase (KDO 8-P synthase)